MHKLITISLFLLAGNLGHAQTPNFFVDGARWVYETNTDSEPGDVWDTSSEVQIVIYGDTVFSGHTYQKLFTTVHRTVYVFHPPTYYHYYDSIGPTFLRYDTVLSRVYYLPAIDSTERRIYDFDLQVGDTTPMQTEYFPFTTIRLIDTVTVFGVQMCIRDRFKNTNPLAQKSILNCLMLLQTKTKTLFCPVLIGITLLANKTEGQKSILRSIMNLLNVWRR